MSLLVTVYAHKVAHACNRHRRPKRWDRRTTLTVSLAVAAMQAGRSVVIVDLDPQATTSKMVRPSRGRMRSGRRSPPSGARLSLVLQAAGKAGADLVFIDTPRRAEQAAISAVKASDLILIPCRPAIYDLETVTTTLDLIRLSEGKPAVAVLNGVHAVAGPCTNAAEHHVPMVVDTELVHAERRASHGDRGEAPSTMITATAKRPRNTSPHGRRRYRDRSGILVGG